MSNGMRIFPAIDGCTTSHGTQNEMFYVLFCILAVPSTAAYHGRMYDIHCNKTTCNCNHHVKMICSPIIGECPSGHYQACDCEVYTTYCNKTCRCNCFKNITCNAKTGDCHSKCHRAGSNSAFIQTVAFSVTGCVVAIAFIVVVCSLIMKRVRKRKTSDQVILSSEIQRKGSSWSYSNEGINETIDEPQQRNYRIHVSSLENYIIQGRKNGTLKEEFEFIEENSETCHSCNVGKSKENERKNRFSTVLPYDYSRVILEKLPNDPHSDYINASYIDGYKSPKKYIAAQGPKPLRMADFWRMVWQERSCKIVMVTNLIESGETKCKKYWPKKTDHYGSLKIQMIDNDVSVDFNIRTFILSQNDKTREVKQFHFTQWPEQKVPLYTKSLLTFIGKVRDYQPLYQCPIIVHSSAGTGRTGAFILLDYVLDMVQWEKHVDFVKCVCHMRQQRMNMVENAEQYVFIYEALLDSLWPFETSIRCYKFNNKLEELKRIDPETGHTRIEEEIERLNRLYSLSHNSNNQTKPPCWLNNVETNQGLIPLSRLSPLSPLSPILFSTFREELNYQHRPFTFVDVDGYRKRKAFLITTFPNGSQLKEFWINVYNNNSLTIVLLHDLQSIADRGFPRYWPREGGVVNFGEFSIKYISKECGEDGVVIRNFTLMDNDEDKCHKQRFTTRKIRHFHLTNWEWFANVPPSPMSLVNLIAKVEKWQQEVSRHTMIVQCLDGVRASGLFCACSFICNKIKLEQEVDVYTAVRNIREMSPSAIENLEQYTFCYTVAGSFLEKFRDYANFSRL